MHTTEKKKSYGIWLNNQQLKHNSDNQVVLVIDIAYTRRCNSFCALNDKFLPFP